MSDGVIIFWIVYLFVIVGYSGFLATKLTESLFEYEAWMLAILLAPFWPLILPFHLSSLIWKRLLKND